MVPEGWEEQILANLTSKPISYGIVQTGPEVPSGTPCVRVIDLTKKSISPSNMITTSAEINDAYRKTILDKDDIMFALRGEIGLVKQVDDDLKGCNLTRGIARISPKQPIVNANFMLWSLRSSYFRSDLLRKVNGSALQEVPLKELRKVKVLVPPISEQKKIAEILSAWDKAIGTVEKLIENSRTQKKALMQQLLSGKKRLPGFTDEWKDKHLDQVAEVIVSPVDKKTISGETPVELCNYMDVYYNARITRSLDFMKATAKPSEIKKYTLQVGDVIITKDSETPGDIAVPAHVSEQLDGVVCGYHLAIVRPKQESSHGEYLNYLFSMPKTRYYFFTLATGATRFGLSVGAIKNAHFTLPPIDEQKAIAEVLSNTDTELELLQRKLEFLKQEKKALMQQLLTGKRRVKVEDAH